MRRTISVLMETSSKLNEIMKVDLELLEACKDQDTYPNPNFLAAVIKQQLEVLMVQSDKLEKLAQSLMEGKE